MTGTIWFLLFGLIIAVDFGRAEVPAIFIFGDSTADVGTNNYLEGSTAKADNPYYGIDYPHSIPTGRFSNGFNTIDLVVKQLGDFEESPPAFLYLVQNMSSFKSNILHGVNFASGGSGISRDTGFRPFINVVPLEDQIEQLATVRGNMTQLLGEAKTESLLNNSMYIISVGSNDLLEYVRYDLKKKSSDLLLSNLTITYQNHLQNLYNLGARKFGIVSIPRIGCVPAVLVYTGGTCIDQLNQLAQAFYASTLDLLGNFSSSFGGVKFSLGNAYAITTDILGNTLSDGFENVTAACCGTGPFNGEDKCTTKSNLCQDRKAFFFWDWYHPTQRVSCLAADKLVHGGADDQYVTPISFSQLASI